MMRCVLCRWLPGAVLWLGCLMAVAAEVPAGFRPSFNGTDLAGWTGEPANAGPVLDAQKAVHEVRRRAGEYQLDPQKIALLGFSAGGQTAVVAATSPPRFEPAAAAGSTRPDAVVLIYPWKVGGPDGKGVRGDVTIEAGTPPMFIAQASNDPASLPQSAAALYLALLEAKVPAELHIYEAGGHGFGMRKRDNAPGTSDWPNRALDWLRGRGL